jgi:two-component system CheB/CheR fusion protein
MRFPTPAVAPSAPSLPLARVPPLSLLLLPLSPGSSAYLAQLTEDLMDASLLQRGVLQLRLESVDIANLVASVAASPQWEGRDVRTSVEDGLGEVAVDPERFRQLLTNLIDNALKYSPADSMVEVCASPDRGGVLIQVIDTGMGIPETSLQRVFEPFGRAVNTGSVPGLGMGLYIAFEIARRHGGSLVASSEGEGRGTTMSLWLPRLPVQTPQPLPADG